MKAIKSLISWTNGKKTFLGLALFFLLGGAKQIGLIGDESFNQLVLLAEVLVGVGVAHKIKKAWL